MLPLKDNRDLDIRDPCQSSSTIDMVFPKAMCEALPEDLLRSFKSSTALSAGTTLSSWSRFLLCISAA